MSKKCGECKWFNKIIGIHCTWHEIEMYPNEEACGDFEPLTVFDHITESVEALAEMLVYWGHDDWGSWWTSNVLDEEYSTPAEAIAATIEELKKEYNKNEFI